MASDIRVKICGLTKSADIATAADAGATYVGFNFFSKSPRFVSVPRAASLATLVPVGICKVSLTVNGDEALLDQLVESVPLDMLQLHGSESPEQVAAIKERYGLPVMKAVGIADEGDLVALDDFLRVADQILVDAKPPANAVLPGGNGLPFDWRLISGRRWPVPWMLAGGLTSENVHEAIHLTGAKQVDVSSGVESVPGIKDPNKVRAFCTAAKG